MNRSDITTDAFIMSAVSRALKGWKLARNLIYESNYSTKDKVASVDIFDVM